MAKTVEQAPHTIVREISPSAVSVAPQTARRSEGPGEDNGVRFRVLVEEMRVHCKLAGACRLEPEDVEMIEVKRRDHRLRPSVCRCMGRYTHNVEGQRDRRLMDDLDAVEPCSPIVDTDDSCRADVRRAGGVVLIGGDPGDKGSGSQLNGWLGSIPSAETKSVRSHPCSSVGSTTSTKNRSS